MSHEANFTAKEIEYVTDRIMKGAGLYDSLRSDFRASPKRVVGWLKNTGTLHRYP